MPAILLLLLQFTAAVALPVADALLRGASGAGVHVEAATGEDCAPLHDHLFCQLCRAINLAGETTPDPVDLPIVAGTLTPQSFDFHEFLGTGIPLAGPLGPRAPPARA